MRYFTSSCLVLFVAVGVTAWMAAEETYALEVGEKMQLPEPRTDSDTSIEEALWRRRSIRSYTSEPLTWEQIAQLLWAAQGINRPGTRYRTAPSAWALYPLTLYVVLRDGVYQYIPAEHAVLKTLEGDVRRSLSDQNAVRSASCVFALCAKFDEMQSRLGDQGIGFAYLEGGHAAQNLVLQATAFGLYGVTVGAITPEQVQAALQIPLEEMPFYLLPIGVPTQPVTDVQGWSRYE
jgi:SagB-type dehydrogenase family enzyme